MAARCAASVCVPVDTRAAVEVHCYPSRTPVLAIRAGHPAALVILTLPERVEAGHVELARLSARYAVEVERTWRGLPALSGRGAPAA